MGVKNILRMHQTIAVVVGLVLIGAIAAGIYTAVAPRTSDTTSSTTTEEAQTEDEHDEEPLLGTADQQLRPACDVLTLEAAQSFLGPGAKISSQFRPSGQNVSGTSCTYGLPDGSRQITLSISGFKTSVEAKDQSGVSRADVQEVSGFPGLEVWWNEKIGQLNALKENRWILIMAGVGKDNAPNLELSKQILHEVSTKL